MNGKLDVDHQNNTFGLCPLRNIGVSNVVVLDRWFIFWWIAVMGFWLIS